ncbi:MAG: PaaX family transcriptional regulator C-terminal domain-containing protein [Ardenticatenaceae bacterium]
MIEEVEQVTRPTKSTQFYIFNLFADYIVPHGGRAWTSDLLYLLGLIGVSDRAARSTLSRMRQRGWFETLKEGRRSRYELTERGAAILKEGDKRIFEEPFADWDGIWHLVVYSLPEEKRKLRNELRKKLIWFGFGNLAPGTWVSSHDRQAELEPILSDLGVRHYVNLFVGQHIGTSDLELVARCWDMPALQKEYDAFLRRYQPAYDTFRQAVADKAKGNKGNDPDDAFSPEACFAKRFWLTFDFQPFPRKDPNLPTVLLPDDWSGYRARQLFLQYRQILSDGMQDFIAQTLKGNR